LLANTQFVIRSADTTSAKMMNVVLMAHPPL
jgi:hypothetical protein